MAIPRVVLPTLNAPGLDPELLRTFSDTALATALEINASDRALDARGPLVGAYMNQYARAIVDSVDSPDFGTARCEPGTPHIPSSIRWGNTLVKPLRIRHLRSSSDALPVATNRNNLSSLEQKLLRANQSGDFFFSRYLVLGVLLEVKALGGKSAIEVAGVMLGRPIPRASTGASSRRQAFDKWAPGSGFIKSGLAGEASLSRLGYRLSPSAQSLELPG
jgi:hypothetical protein